MREVTEGSVQAKMVMVQHLAAAEQAIERTGETLGELLAASLRAGALANLSLELSSRAVNGIVASIGRWGETRVEVVGAHRHLAVLDRRLGTVTVAGGDLGEKPPISDDAPGREFPRPVHLVHAA